MSDDWRDREIRRNPDPDDREENYVRWRLERHRDALAELAESAPLPWVAERCRELSRQIDTELGVDHRRFTHSETPLPDVAFDDEYESEPREEDEEDAREAFDELVRPRAEHAEIRSSYREDERAEPRRIAAPLVVIASAIVFLSVIAALVWWTRPDREPSSPATVQSTGPTIEVTEEIPPSGVTGEVLTLDPDGHDFGLVYRGQRVTQTFAIRNVSDSRLDLRLQRSQCRCLWYQYDDKLAPGEAGEITIAIDGGRAPSGRLRETVGVVLRDTDELVAEIHLTAEIE